MKNSTLKCIQTVVAIMAATVVTAQEPFGLDLGFRTTLKQTGIGSILPLPDGEVIVSGVLRYPNDLENRGGVRLNSNGTRNTDFANVAYMGGKIVAWGNKFYCGLGAEVTRNNLDGTLDSSYIRLFMDSLIVLYQGGDYLVFPDGRLLLTGLNQLLDSARGFVGNYGLVWITNSGHVDTTRIHRSANGPIFLISALADGKFLCWGPLNEFDGQSVGQIFRVLPDGALDTTYHSAPYGQYSFIYSIVPLPDGKVLVGGSIRLQGVSDTLSLIRLLPDGGLDTTFHSIHLSSTWHPFQHYSYITDILPLGTDRYIVTGSFDHLDGSVRGGIAILDTAGNLLDDYFTGDGCGQYSDGFSQLDWKQINGITPAPDGSFYIYGNYHGYDDGTTNDTLQRLITRLNGLDVGIRESSTAPKALGIQPNPSAGSTWFSLETPIVKGVITIHDASGRVAWQGTWPAGSANSTLPAHALAPGSYVVRVSEADTPGYTGRLVVMP